jgi:hypothetical protein
MTMSSLGTGWDQQGNEVYMVMEDASFTSGNTATMYHNIACDFQNVGGLYATSWSSSGTAIDPTLGQPTAFAMEGSHTPAYRYLPDESEVGSIGSWTYAFDMSLYESAQGMDLGAATLAGTFVEVGFVTVNLEGQDVEGYRLTNTFTMDYPGYDPTGLGLPELMQGKFTRNSYVEQVWIAGVGLYSETHQADYDDGSTFTSTKQLDSVSGLTPIQ